MNAVVSEFNGECRAAIFCIGGAGCNVASMLSERLCNADVIALNTDAENLATTQADISIPLSNASTRGNVETAAQYALAREEEIRALIRNYQFVYIIAGMGGGAGTGIAPVIAQFCTLENVRFEAGAIMPFNFERNLQLKAADGYRALHAQCKEDVYAFANESSLSMTGVATIKDALTRMNTVVCDFIEEILSDIRGLVNRRVPPTGGVNALLTTGGRVATS